MFNIITPTYNRRHTLDRVYSSLLNQTYKEFNWIIVDDCSTDDTHELVQEWIDENKLDIDYHYLEKNGGKSAAVNYALDHCNEIYTIIADSDDSFVPETLSDLKSLWQSIKNMETKREIASIWTLTTDENGNVVGDKFPSDQWVVNFKERVLKHKIKGEKWACWRTKVLANYKMYVNENSNIIQESHTWNRINADYDFLCVNVAHRCYHYTSDGLIAKKKSKEETARIYYYGSFFGLKDVPLSDIISHKYYRSLAFEYVKSSLYYTDRSLKLSFTKTIVCIIIFVVKLPKRLMKKIR